MDFLRSDRARKGTAPARALPASAPGPFYLGWGPAMELFRAEKIATVRDQSNHDCRFCAGRLTLLKTIMEYESGVVIHIFECGQCGERIWS